MMKVVASHCFAVAVVGCVVALGGSLRAGDPGFPIPDGLGDLSLPCHTDCLKTAAAKAMACQEAGGNFFDCAKEFGESLKECLGGCDEPDLPPICGEECLKAARQAAAACHDAEEDVVTCLTAVKDELKSCLETAGCDAPPVPEFPRCGLECLRTSVTAAKECLKGGGDLLDCARTFRAAFEECRAASDCGKPDEPPPEPEADAQVLSLLVEQSFVRGDANRDAAVDISDPIATLNVLFVGAAPLLCLDAADANDDGSVDIGDPIFTFHHLYESGSASLPAPYPTPGVDATPDALRCDD